MCYLLVMAIGSSMTTWQVCCGLALCAEDRGFSYQHWNRMQVYVLRVKNLFETNTLAQQEREAL